MKTIRVTQVILTNHQEPAPNENTNPWAYRANQRFQNFPHAPHDLDTIDEEELRDFIVDLRHLLGDQFDDIIQSTLEHYTQEANAKRIDGVWTTADGTTFDMI